MTDAATPSGQAPEDIRLSTLIMLAHYLKEGEIHPHEFQDWFREIDSRDAYKARRLTHARALVAKADQTSDFDPVPEPGPDAYTQTLDPVAYGQHRASNHQAQDDQDPWVYLKRVATEAEATERIRFSDWQPETD